MSKSRRRAGHAHLAARSAGHYRKKIMRATTDSAPAVDFALLGQV